MNKIYYLVSSIIMKLTPAVWESIISRLTPITVPSFHKQLAWTLPTPYLTHLVSCAINVTFTFETEWKVVVTHLTPKIFERILPLGLENNRKSILDATLDQ